MTFRCKRILITTVLILGLSIQTPATAVNHRTNKTNESDYLTSDIPEKIFKPKPKQHDVSFAISPDTVLYKLKQKQKIALIDVRNPEDFERMHIPDSLNIPLYAVKTKVFLKRFAIVLVDEGFCHAQLVKECRHLRELGFKAFILDGGLAAWECHGNRLVGDLFALEEIRLISPQILFQEKDYENTLVIDISPIQTKLSKQLLPDSKCLPLPAESGCWARKFGRTIASHKNKPFLSILFVSQTGDGYDRVNKILADLDLNVFYLQGGLAAYKNYIEDLMLSWRPRQNRIKTSRKCGTCLNVLEKDNLTEVGE